jgi:23S rRNA (cytosine1962-C5)-methyltransferase
MANLPIRWIVDDVRKFAGREIKRAARYDAVILDPPSFGRGSRQQVFKIEEDLLPLLRICRDLLSDNPLFVCLSAHTPGFSGLVLANLLCQVFAGGGGETLESGDLTIDSERSFPLTLGTYAIWTR